MAAIMPAYVMYGFDTASSLAEETKDPRRRTPIAILQALAASGAAGALLLILALMATKTLSLSDLTAGGLPMILQTVLGSTVGKLLLIDVAFAIFVCTLAIQTAAIRVAFSMARDHRLPFGERLAHVTEERHSPAAPAIVTGVIAIGILLVNIGNAKIFTLVTSVAIVIVYLAYLMVTAPVLGRRLGGWPTDGGRTGLFTLGRRRGLLINSIAVAYGLFMTINLVWPRQLIYGEGVYAWGGVIVIAVVVALGAIYYFTAQHRKGHVIASEHRATDSAASASGAPASNTSAPLSDGGTAPAPAFD
jgi:amino acid transporter